MNKTSKLINLQEADQYLHQLADPIERHILVSLLTTFLIYHQKFNNQPQEDVDMLFIIKTFHYWIRDRDIIISMLRGEPIDDL